MRPICVVPRPGLPSTADLALEACRANMMSLRTLNDCYVDSTMAAVHGQLLCLCSSVDAVRGRTELPSVMDRRI